MIRAPAAGRQGGQATSITRRRADLARRMRDLAKTPLAGSMAHRPSYREHYPNRSGCGALLRSREPLNSTVEFVTRRQNGQMDGVIRSSIPAAACLPARSSTTTCSIAPLLVSYPVATHVMRPERLGRQPVGVQAAGLHAPQPTGLKDMDPVRRALPEEPLTVFGRGGRHRPDASARAVPREPEHRCMARINRPYQRCAGHRLPSGRWRTLRRLAAPRGAWRVALPRPARRWRC